MTDPSTIPERSIERPDKGLTMRFYSDRVTKDYRAEPNGPHISREEQTQRFEGELNAYRRFNALKCPFVPELLDASEENRYFTIARIPGTSLLELSQHQPHLLSMKNIIEQLDTMDEWLRGHGFPDMGNNTKDIILSDHHLYLIDFEDYRTNQAPTDKDDIFNAILRDILDRIIIRRGRKAQMTKPFRHMALCFFARRPMKTLTTAFRCLFKKFKLAVRGK